MGLISALFLSKKLGKFRMSLNFGSNISWEIKFHLIPTHGLFGWLYLLHSAFCCYKEYLVRRMKADKIGKQTSQVNTNKSDLRWSKVTAG